MFTYIHNGEYHTDTSDEYLSSLTDDEEVHEHIRQCERLYEENLSCDIRAERDRRLSGVLQAIERHQLQLLTPGVAPEGNLSNLLALAQLLRDVPQQSGFPFSVEWPEET